ncbi:uncharacterized protein A1O9_11173 [Exophiala aquamarina CBS 119918]|uniref:Major facilitator superfamily (MFS) profile domain-containing protein n=1 Tax=Exophiala aquamarina CBS 119918 TaxID=1182545 RepID=A0A072NYX4_9EURO|nr:uncharacterized protein A1O9_11173 [Exophiala aquamarina CBS 119918]KEF52756.1 hypothetical protein A1O9_11173 [Exophiala aquamarina CBS 119918]
MGTVFGLPSFYSYFKLNTTGPNATYANNIIGATNGIYSGGGIIGCLCLPWLADHIGRKRTIQITCLICIVAVVLQCGAVHVGMLLIGRFLGGASAGMMNCIVPLYMSEVAPPARRGKLVGLHGTLLVLGYGLAGWTGLGCYFEPNPQIQWRLCLALQLVAPLALILPSPKLPESPRYLLQKGRHVEALALLCRLHHSPEDPHDIMAREESVQIQRQLELDKSMPKGLVAIVRTPSLFKRYLLGVFVQCLAQSTGVLVVNNYQVILLNGLGLTGWLPLLLYAIYASWAAVLNLVAALIVDRAGRVRLLCIGITGCALMMTVYTALVAKYSGTTNKTGQAFAVLFLYLFVTFYALCVDAVSYVYCSEIFPTSLRASGMAASVTGLFATTLLYTQPAPQAFAVIGWKYYLIFIIVPICGVPFLYLFAPETKGLRLEEVGALFGEQIAIDFTHMNPEERARFDRELLHSDDGPAEKVLESPIK